MQPYCDEETFHQLCMLLSFTKLTDHNTYKDWTAQKGRLDCFQQIRYLFSYLNKQGAGDTTTEKRRAPTHRLTKLLKDAVSFQYLTAK